MIKTIEYKIAQSESEWCRYRIENMGIRESFDRLCNAVRRKILKVCICAVRTFRFSMKNKVFHPTYIKNKENIVVSMTSIAGRIKDIYPAINSIITQTQKPDLIVLWLGDNCSYPKRTISKIEAMGIKVEYCNDLGPNTKYHYAFKEYNNDLVITVDDDIIYHEKMIEELYSTHLKHPEMIIARRVHKIRFGLDRLPVSYRNWIWEYRNSCQPSHELLATGVGGVLYTPAVMKLNCWETTDFINVCPACDDIWLKFCELSQNIKVCAVDGSQFYKDAINKKTQKNALALENVDNEKNDVRLSSCARYFGMSNLCEKVLEEE